MGGGKAFTGFWLENLRKETTGETRCIWADNIKADIKEVRCGVWTGLSWLGIETGGRHFKCGKEPWSSIK
jgi:hypothetical protein